MLVDVMTGSEIPGSVLADLVGSGQLVFEAIERIDSRERTYGPAAVVTGADADARAIPGPGLLGHSRYTHVYVRGDTGWRLASAQGTPIAAG